MRKIIIGIVCLFVLLNFSVGRILATSATLTPSSPINLSIYKDKKITLTVTGPSLFVTSLGYTIYLDPPGSNTPFLFQQLAGNDPNSRSFEWELLNNLGKIGTWRYEICSGGRSSGTCVFTGSFEIAAAAGGNPNMTAEQNAYQAGTPAKFLITNAVAGTNYDFWWDGNTGVQVTKTAPGSAFDVSNIIVPTDGAPRIRNFCMQPSQFSFWGFGLNCSTPGMYAPVQITIVPPPSGGGTGMSTCPTDPNKPTTLDGVPTALGCVATKPEDFVAQLLGWVIGLGGGIAFLLIVFGGFQVVTSSGNPEKLDAGKEIIVSALTGLLMIVFSVILLHLIGVDILHIPGFGV